MALFLSCSIFFYLFVGSSLCVPIERPRDVKATSWDNLAIDDNIFSDDPCEPVPPEIVKSANLTTDELNALWLICWNRVVAVDRDVLANGLRPGIPEGVECERTTWCDGGGICSEVCKRGTVVVSPWLRNAIKSQTVMARSLPLCHAQFLGTHNSAVTLVDGYGNRDKYFEQMLRLSRLSTTAKLETNNQWFSLTDQLNMGARMIELDVHWVKSHLRIAHCGGMHSHILDDIISAINIINRWLGNPAIMWDTETIGCSPSLSSIAADDQRYFVDALAEIHTWLHQTENLEEFVFIYLDEQMDLLNWDKVDNLLMEVLGVFPRSMIFTPEDKYSYEEWPTADELVRKGKRILIATRQSFTEDLHEYFFRKGEDGMCNWSEPNVKECFKDKYFEDCIPAMNGTLLRVETCELMYGPLNCDMELGWNKIPLNENTLPTILDCGINFPSPDRLTPERAAAAIWSWAHGEPRTIAGTTDECALMSAADGRWNAAPCSGMTEAPVSCRKKVDDLFGPDWDSSWIIGEERVCPEGFEPGAPRHGKENENLRQSLVENDFGRLVLGGDIVGLPTDETAEQ